MPISNIRAHHETTSFFFIDPATTEIYTLSLHDALPICRRHRDHEHHAHGGRGADPRDRQDRKSTRLNSSHTVSSYAVFCLKKKRRKRANNSSKTSSP